MWGRCHANNDSSSSSREPTCVQQLCGVGAMQTMIAAAAVGSPQGTPAVWGRCHANNDSSSSSSSSSSSREPTRVQQLCGVGAMQTMIAAAAAVGSPQGTPAMWGRCHANNDSSRSSSREPTCVQQLCGVGAMPTMIAAAAAVGSPQGTPAMWGR